MKQTILIAFSCLFLVACSTKQISGHENNEFNFEEVAYLSSATTYISSEKLINNSIYLSEPSYLNINETDYVDKTTEPLDLNISSKVKHVDHLTYQTVIDEEDSISFYTWDGTGAEIEMIDITSFNNQEMIQGLQIGKFYYQLWHEVEDFFLSYHDLELDLTFIDAAENGKVPTSKGKIGMSKDDLISILGDPIVTDWYHGGIYYQYNEQAFIFDDQFNVTAIMLPGNRIKILLQDVPQILGEPTDITLDELDNTLFYSYKLDKFTLSFEAESKVKLVRNVWVMENW